MSAKKPNAQLKRKKLKMLRLPLRMPALIRKPLWLTIREDIRWSSQPRQLAEWCARIPVSAPMIGVVDNAQTVSCINTCVGEQSCF